jgi:hypothetical protein
MLLMIVNRRPHSCEAAHVETKIQRVGPEEVPIYQLSEPCSLKRFARDSPQEEAVTSELVCEALGHRWVPFGGFRPDNRA